MPISTIAKTDAITLRVAPFSNTSHIVTWLTPTHGKIATVIKGACRPKSHVMGQYDIGFLCELLFYERDRNGLYILKECSPIDPRSDCRGDWQRTAAIGYLCHLAAVATPDGAHAPELYELLDASLNHISTSFSGQKVHNSNLRPRIPASLLFWFELRLLNLLGIPPQLSNCTRCTKDIDTVQQIAFSAHNGGMVCNTCIQNQNGADIIRVTKDILAILKRWQASQEFDSVRTINCTTEQQRQIQELLGTFLTCHLDLAPECRFVSYQMLNTNILAA